LKDLSKEQAQSHDKSTACFSYLSDLEKTKELALFNAVVSCASGMEALLFDELKEILSVDGSLQDNKIKQSNASVELSCPLKSIYQICLWSRIAEQVLISVADIYIFEKTQQAYREF